MTSTTTSSSTTTTSSTEEYNKVSICKKEAHCVVFNIEPSLIKESTCIEYRSPVFTFDQPPREECYLSFVSVLVKDKLASAKVSHITLHFVTKSTSSGTNGSLPEDSCTYQVVGSVLNRPEFALHAFQSHRYNLAELKHWKYFSLNELSKICSSSSCSGSSKSNALIQLCFDVSRFSSSGEYSSCDASFAPPRHNERLQRLHEFALNGDYTDVTLKVGDEEIRAHKNILAAHSKVFDAMFKSRMLEEQTGLIRMEEFQPRIVQAMLLYVYTDRVKEMERDARELFEAAHYYDLYELEALCKRHMMANITMENVTALSDLADKYGIKEMQANVNKFIKLNEAQLVKNPDYIRYLMSRLSISNVARCLVLADKYKLKEFKAPLKEYVKDNIKDVIRDSKYRYLYTTNMNLILEIDEFLADTYKK